VCVGIVDPDVRVSGRGIRLLRDAGMEVVVCGGDDLGPRVGDVKGDNREYKRCVCTCNRCACEKAKVNAVCEEIYHRINQYACASLRPYLYARRRGKPYVVLKIALSLDGAYACADNTSQWLTGRGARKHAHGERAKHQAICVGSG